MSRRLQHITHIVNGSTSPRMRLAGALASARGCRSLHRIARAQGALAGATALVINVAAQVQSKPVDSQRFGAFWRWRAADDYVSGGAIEIRPATSIQSIVNMHPGQTTFCLRAGVHQLTSSIRPKTGNIFVGEFGAILDGTGWTTADDTQAAFRAHNEDIDYVTIRNLVIRNMPQRGIQAFYRMSDYWTIEYNEIAFNRYGPRVRDRLHHPEQLRPP